MTIAEGRILRMAPFNKARHKNYIDFTPFTLLPGLIDAHVHLSFSPDGSCQDDMIACHLKANQECGIVAVRDAGDADRQVLNYATGLKSNQYFTIKAGVSLHKKGRYGRQIARGVGKGDLKIEKCGDHLKIINCGLNSLENFAYQSPPQFDLEEMQALVKSAHQQNLKVMVHANGILPVRIALQAGVDSIEHGFFMGKDNLKMMADRAVTWVPTAATMQVLAKAWPAASRQRQVALKNLEHQLEQIQTAAAMGVKIAVGTDAGSPGIYHGSAIIDELKMLIRAGLSIQKAIQCATTTAATLLNLEWDGLIREGISVNLLAIKGHDWTIRPTLSAIKCGRVHLCKGKHRFTLTSVGLSHY